MTKSADALAHKFPQFNTPTLRSEADKTEARIKLIQRSSGRHTQGNRVLLSTLQSELHRMKMELKRRDEEEKRARANAVMA